jgi:hypothetical protein
VLIKFLDLHISVYYTCIFERFYALRTLFNIRLKTLSQIFDLCLRASIHTEYLFFDEFENSVLLLKKKMNTPNEVYKLFIKIKIVFKIQRFTIKRHYYKSKSYYSYFTACMHDIYIIIVTQ